MVVAPRSAGCSAWHDDSLDYWGILCLTRNSCGTQRFQTDLLRTFYEMGPLPRSNKGARANNTSFGLGSVCSHQPFVAWTFVHVPAASVHHTPAPPISFPSLLFSFYYAWVPDLPCMLCLFQCTQFGFLSEEDSHPCQAPCAGADQAWIRHDPF